MTRRGKRGKEDRPLSGTLWMMTLSTDLRKWTTHSLLAQSKSSSGAQWALPMRHAMRALRRFPSFPLLPLPLSLHLLRFPLAVINTPSHPPLALPSLPTPTEPSVLPSRPLLLLNDLIPSPRLPLLDLFPSPNPLRLLHHHLPRQL